MASFYRGEIPCLHALTISPNVLGSHIIPPTATLVRLIDIPPTGPDILVNEVAYAPSEQFTFTFRCPRAALEQLTMDMRETPDRVATAIRMQNARRTMSWDDILRKAKDATLLEMSSIMEAWIIRL